MTHVLRKIGATVAAGSAALTLGLTATAQSASALTSACGNILVQESPDVFLADAVTNVGACEISDSASQDFLNTNPMTVNAEEFFGFTDWIFAEKIGSDETIDIGASGDGSGANGDWSVASNIFSVWSDVMMVFKSGNGTFLTGYKLDGVNTSGEWVSPFPQYKNNGDLKDDPKAVSHISFYVRQGSTPPPEGVPEPGMAIGLGAVAFGLLRKRMQDNA
jgi:hypothetical protein